MTKSEAGPSELKSGEPPPAENGPSPELVERFRQFEVRVDEAVRLIGELRREKRGLATRLDEEKRARAEAVQRIDTLLEKIDGLL